MTKSDGSVYGIGAPYDTQSVIYNTIPAAGGYVISDDKTKSGYDLELIKELLERIEKVSGKNSQEYQKYDIYKKENTDLYWCHFSGSYAEDFLKSYNLYDKRIITLSPNIQYRRIYSLLRVTLDKREKHFTDLCAVYLQELLLTVSRDMHKASSNQNMPDELKHILNYIEEHYYEDITIDELSKIGLMNKLKLTRYFNEYLKCPPKKYLFNYRINKAKTLLLQTNHKVNEIAFSVGYSNPLYFSTIFRQETGLSPREFREQNK